MRFTLLNLREYLEQRQRINNNNEPFKGKFTYYSIMLMLYVTEKGKKSLFHVFLSMKIQKLFQLKQIKNIPLRKTNSFQEKQKRKKKSKTMTV